MFSYMNRPVSVIRPTYSASADRASGLDLQAGHQVPDDLGRARGVGPTRLTVPKRVLSWWWSMLSRWMPGPAQRLGRVAVEVAAVQEHDRALIEVFGRLGDQAVERQEPVLLGQRQLARVR